MDKIKKIIIIITCIIIILLISIIIMLKNSSSDESIFSNDKIEEQELVEDPENKLQISDYFLAKDCIQNYLDIADKQNSFYYDKQDDGSQKYNDFPVNDFFTGAWVRYSPNTRLIGFFCGVVGSMLAAYLIKKTLGGLSVLGKKSPK